MGANHAEDITHIGPADWQPLGPLADLSEGVPLRRRAGAVDVVVVRRGADVTVLADRCSHLSAPLSDGDPYPVDVTRLKPGTVVGDVVTKPAVPPLIVAARAAGCPASTGTDMFGRVAGLIVDFLLDSRPPESNYRITDGE